MFERFADLEAPGRYARQSLLPGWSQERLARARVLVAGAGALGNEALKSLALLGVGTLGIVDFDRVEESNLPRCVLFRQADIGLRKAEVAARAVRALQPGVQARGYALDLLTEVGAGVMEDFDLVLGDLDSSVARWQLNRLARRAGRRWIDAGVDGVCGQVTVYDPAEGACYECGMTDAMWAQINQRHSCSAPGEPGPPAMPVAVAAPVVAVTAALQVQEAVRWLMRPDGEEPGRGLQPGERLAVHLDGYQMLRMRSRVRSTCLAHAEPAGPARAVGLHREATAEALLQAVQGQALRLDWEVADRLECSACGESATALPEWQMTRAALSCPACGRECFAQRTATVRAGDALAGHPLWALGVPAEAHLRVQAAAGGEFWCKLTGSPAAEVE